MGLIQLIMAPNSNFDQNSYLAGKLPCIQNIVKLQSVFISIVTLKSGWFIGLIRFKMFMRRWHRFYY